MICAVAAGKPAAVARAAMVTCEEVLRGVHVAEYRPVLLSTRERTWGGSPLEKVVTTWPPAMALPQSSMRLMASGTGQAAGAEKLLTRPVCVGTSWVGLQPVAEMPRGLSAGAATGSTMSVTLTVRTAETENA